MTLNKIRELCQIRGISLTELEQSVKLSNGTICKWDGKSPGVENVRKVAAYFGVTVDELLREDANDGEQVRT